MLGSVSATSKLIVAAALGAVAISVAPTIALGGPNILCDRIEADSIEIDGMMDDWRGLKPTKQSVKAKDLAVAVRCVLDDAAVYLSVEVTDERIIRNAKGTPKTDDHVRLTLKGSGTAHFDFLLLPGGDKIAPKRTESGKKISSKIAVEDSQTATGYAIELQLPYTAYRGYGPAAPTVEYTLEVGDADLASEGKLQDKLTLRGQLMSAASAGAYKTFLATTKLTAKEIKLNTYVELDGSPGAERLIAGGKILGVVTDRFGFIELPVATAADVLSVKTVDLFGHGVHSVLTEVRQHGGGGSRDLLIVWRYGSAGSFEQIFAVETRKARGANVLGTTWKLVKSNSIAVKSIPRRKKAGFDIYLEAVEPIGWDEDSYDETAAPDSNPILQPWDEDHRRALYRFEAGKILGGPIPKK